MPHDPDHPAGLALADLLLDGKLARTLRGWRADDLSWDACARELRDLTKKRIDVSGNTVKDWADRLQIDA